MYYKILFAPASFFPDTTGSLYAIAFYKLQFRQPHGKSIIGESSSCSFW